MALTPVKSEVNPKRTKKVKRSKVKERLKNRVKFSLNPLKYKIIKKEKIMIIIHCQS